MLLGTTLEVVFDPSTCLMNHSPLSADRQNRQGWRSSSSLSKFSDIVHLLWFNLLCASDIWTGTVMTAMSCLVTLQFTWSGASLSQNCKSEIIKFSNTISKVFLLLLLCCCYNHWLNRQLQWTTTEVRHLFCIFRAYLWCHRRIISTRRHLEPTARFLPAEAEVTRIRG